jgi:hypothetical protein
MRYVDTEDGVALINRDPGLLETKRAALYGFWPVRAMLGRSGEIP